MTKCLLDIGTNSLGGYEKLVPILGIDDSWVKIFVEPNPECYEYIYHRMNGIPNSRLLEVAIAPENKEYELLTRDDMKGDSAATIMGSKFINDSIGEVNQKYPSYLSFKVQGMKIDDILKSITEDEIYLKLDCEGAEFSVLENFPVEYLHKIMKIFVEFHAHDDIARERRDKIIQHYASCGIELLNWD